MKKNLLFAVLHDRGSNRNMLNGIRRQAMIKGNIVIGHPPPVYARWKGFTLAQWVRSVKPDGIFLPISCTEFNEIVNMGLPGIVHRDLAKRQQADIPAHMPVVLGDGYAMGKMAAEHLLEQGMRNFAYFGLTRSMHSQERKRGFCDRLALAGHQAAAYQWPFARLRHILKQGKNSFTQWLKNLPKPVGVLGIADSLTPLVAQACMIGGLHVPEDVAIIGIDDDVDLCETFLPPLSSVALNEQKIGVEVLNLLYDIATHRKKMSGQKLIVRPTRVVARQSTAVMLCGDPGIKKALRFIEDHNSEVIGVEDVARALATNSTTLQQKFRRHLRETVHERIVKSRVRRISQMLLETDMSISQVADATGFSHTGNFTQFFTKATGKTPKDFRNQAGKK